MTSPLQPVARLSERVTKLERQRVTQRAATVVAVHTATSTFDADVEGAGRLNGIPAPAAFMPAVGDRVTLDLRGATPVYQPGRIGEGAVGDDELAAGVKEQITTALDAANGKNKVYFSTTDPATAGISATTAGDVWFQKDVFGLGVIVASWEWDGTAWVPKFFGDSVLNSLTVGKLVSGTGTFDMLLAGSIRSGDTGSRYLIDSTGIKLYSGASATPTVDLNAVTGNATFRGTVEGALIRTSASGQRLEIQSGGTAGGRTLSFYPAGAGQAATVFSRDDPAGNAGISMESGGTNRGFVNFTSVFAAIGLKKGTGQASFVRVADDFPYGVTIGVEADRALLINAPLGIDMYAGAGRFANLTQLSGLEGVGKFSLTYSGLSSFTFGVNAGETNADIYGLRFIATNPGGTGGFVYFSDRRLKRDVRPVAFDALAEVLSMPVREFDWNSTGEKSFGFMAQDMPADVQVHLSPDKPIDGIANPVGVASELVMAKLVKAVQQLDAKVELLRRRVL